MKRLVVAAVLLAIATVPSMAKPKNPCPKNSHFAGIYSGKGYCCPKGTRLVIDGGQARCYNPKAETGQCPEGQPSIYMGNGRCLVWH